MSLASLIVFALAGLVLLIVGVRAMRAPLIALAVALLATAGLNVNAAPESPASSAATATIETLSAIANTDGWCVATNGTASVDVDAAAPARVTAQIKSRVRFISLLFVGGATSTRICHELGGTLPTASCDALDLDAQGVLRDGETVTYAVARDFGTANFPQLDMQANAGTDGALCVTIGW